MIITDECLSLENDGGIGSINSLRHSLNDPLMFVPITSEITLSQGMLLKEIATGRLFEIGTRLKGDADVWGDDPLEIREAVGATRDSRAVGYNELAEKYWVAVAE